MTIIKIVMKITLNIFIGQSTHSLPLVIWEPNNNQNINLVNLGPEQGKLGGA